MAPVTRIILQVRTSSSRLPAKALLPVGGLPLAVLAARRAMRAGFGLTAATSIDPTDDLLAALLGRHGIPVFRGSLDDVLERFAKAADDLPDDAVVVRLTGDNVFPDGEFIRQLVAAFLARGRGYLGCGGDHRRIPYGLSAEVFDASTLKAAAAAADSPYDREHVTPWIRRAHAQHDVPWVPDTDADSGHLRCTVDTLDDYLKVAAVFDLVRDPVTEPWRKLVACLRDLSGAPPILPALGGAAAGPKMILGTAQLGMNYGRSNATGMPGGEEARAIMRCAIENGVTEWDTARAYGSSEDRIGEFLIRGTSPDVIPLTKLDPLVDLREDWPIAAIHAAVDASVFASCRALRRFRLPTMMLHRAHHLRVAKRQVWMRLLTLRSEGLIDRLGLSVRSPAELEEALAVPEIVLVQMPYNIVDWRWEGCAAMLRNRPDVTVHVRSAFLQGILATTSSERWPSIETLDSQRIIESLQRLARVLERQSVPDLLIAYARSQPWVSGVVVGVETLAQLRSNLDLFRLPPLTAGEVVIVRDVLPRVPQQFLDPAHWP